MTAVSADGFFDSNRERRTLDDVVTVDYPENVSNIQIQLFFQQARQAYAEVSEYLGVHVPVSIHIGSHSRLQIDMNYNYKILFPQKYLGHRTPGLWHEITHALTKTSGEFYPEGLGEHVRFKYGNRRDKDIHPFVTNWWKRYINEEDGKELMPSDIIHIRIGGSEWRGTRIRRGLNYSVAASFVTYLINDVLKGSREDRIRPFMNFFMAKNYSDSAHREYFGKPFKELEDGWYQMLQERYGYEPIVIPEAAEEEDRAISEPGSSR